MATFDLAIAGSGFAGSLMAMVARRLGLSVLLLEKGSHPRVVIGESTTPLSNLLLEQIASQYDLPFLQPMTKWGTWQQTYPEVACGRKRGFTFFHHEVGSEKSAATSVVDRQLLVAASPNDAIADTHWFRADVDLFLMQKACAMGAEYIDGCDIKTLHRANNSWLLDCVVAGRAQTMHARFIVDATGPRGLFHRLLRLPEAPLPGMQETCALFSHFMDATEYGGAQQYVAGMPPYPPDEAALHHVFDGGWMWVLRFNNGWTSAGCAAKREVADRFRFQDGEAAWKRLLAALPAVASQFAGAKRMMPFTFAPRLPFRSASIAGEGWAMLPSAAGFVDPLLSTGFPLTLLGILRLAQVFERHWESDHLFDNLCAYAQRTDGELLTTADLIGALYANMHDFQTFRAITLLYFAAASFAETARRLDKEHLASSFLLHTGPVFGRETRRLTALARQPLNASQRRALQTDILTLVEQFDVAGLTKQPEDHCYPVRAEDLFAGATKVQASEADIRALLTRSGFYQA